jgi:hypothetical protein
MKICTHSDCNRPVFSKGFCIYHYKKKRTRTSLNKLPKKTGEADLFNKIWNSRPHKSELSGISLERYEGTEYFYWMFAHILDKKNYPLFRLEEENIMIVEPFNEHRLLDQGSSDQRISFNNNSKRIVNWDLFYQKKEYLLKKYHEHLKQLL